MKKLFALLILAVSTTTLAMGQNELIGKLTDVRACRTEDSERICNYFMVEGDSILSINLQLASQPMFYIDALTVKGGFVVNGGGYCATVSYNPAVVNKSGERVKAFISMKDGSVHSSHEKCLATFKK